MTNLIDNREKVISEALEVLSDFERQMLYYRQQSTSPFLKKVDQQYYKKLYKKGIELNEISPRSDFV